MLFCSMAGASQNAGLAGGPLRVSTGAFLTGTGGAGIAGAEYLISYHNPSLLPLLRERRVSVGAGLRSLGRTESWASFDFRVPPRMGMGVSFLYRGDPFLNGMYDGYYEQGTVVEEQPLDNMGYGLFNIKIGAGYLVSKRLTMGASVAVVHQSLPALPLGDGKVENATSTSIGAIDLAATYKISKKLTLAAVMKNLGGHDSWDFNTEAQGVAPVLVLAGSYQGKFKGRELIWNIDMSNYLVDGEWKLLDHPEMVIATGVQWNFRDDLFLRLGIGDLELSSELYRRSDDYFSTFSPRLTTGFTYDMSKIRPGMRFNYALATDRVWAGIDQQFDLTIAF